MKKFAAFIAACAAGLLMTATIAHAGVGIPSIPIGLEHDPGGSFVARGVTDGEGSVTFVKLPSGRYVLAIIDTSKLKAPARIVVDLGGVGLPEISEQILPGKSGAKAYALDKSGRRLVVEIALPKTSLSSRALPSGKIAVKVETAR